MKIRLRAKSRGFYSGFISLPLPTYFHDARNIILIEVIGFSPLKKKVTMFKSSGSKERENLRGWYLNYIQVLENSEEQRG